MRHALSEHLPLAVLGVGVDQVVIAGKPGEVDDVRFRERAPDALGLVADDELPVSYTHLTLPTSDLV